MMREWFEGINAETPIADGSMIERVPAGPCGGELIRRDETDESRLVIYYHGGGFFFRIEPVASGDRNPSRPDVGRCCAGSRLSAGARKPGAGCT
ncbi:hypothetical protein A4U53_004460 (plasmid) [Rhizobium ruizarguesonis]|uniref:Uncharacterized protein n=1 Tax=Rhizobium ruizarguesonis TaxID=2081791 RepID=A0ACD5EGX0_9HYPH